MVGRGPGLRSPASVCALLDSQKSIADEDLISGSVPCYITGDKNYSPLKSSFTINVPPDVLSQAGLDEISENAFFPSVLDFSTDFVRVSSSPTRLPSVLRMREA